MPLLMLGIGPLLSLGRYLLSCTVCMIALAIGGAWVAGDVHGHRKADAKCHAADLAMQLKAKERDAAIAADAAKLAQQQADDLAKENAQLGDKVRAYEAALKARPGPGCPLTDDDLRQLRDIGR